MVSTFRSEPVLEYETQKHCLLTWQWTILKQEFRQDLTASNDTGILSVAVDLVLPEN